MTPDSLQALMAVALAMENEAVQRYTELADMMETHNNDDVAAMFRAMAGYEAEHAAVIMKRMGWQAAPPLPRESYGWPGFDSPEAVATDDAHYLMKPWHALQLALAAERRAHDFFERLVSLTSDEGVRRAARQMQAEEAEHIGLVQAWIEKFPPPDPDWALDPDPPRYTD